jgi:NAD(P)H-nitrite reductase large subunit
LKNDPVTNPLDKLPPVLKQNLERNLCTCNEVVKRDIINAIVNGATTVEEIKKQTYATMGTGCCRQQVERLIECLCAPETNKRRRRTKRDRGEKTK